MSTAQCEIGIVRIRVGLINDILRFNYKYSTIFSFRKFKYHPFLSLSLVCAFGSTQAILWGVSRNSKYRFRRAIFFLILKKILYINVYIIMYFCYEEGGLFPSKISK